MVALINANTLQEVGYRATVIKSIKNESPNHVFGGILSNSNATADGDTKESAAVATTVLGTTTVIALAMTAFLAI